MSFYAYVTSGGGKYLITNRASGWGAGVFVFQVSAAATQVSCTFYGYDLGGYTIVPETWYHISAVKSGDTITLYLNGATPAAGGGYSQSHSGVNNVSMGSSGKAVDIGSNGTADYFKGYITDLRIVKGTAITPPSGGPTERLEAVTNTSLLTCHLPYIADGSSNYHAITVNGNTSTKPFSPYNYDEYSATDHGGSVYFVGGANFSSQYLSLSGPTMPSGDFTLSTWAYLKSASDNTLIDFNGNSGGFRIMYVSNSNGGYHFRFYVGGGSVYLYDQSVDHYPNQWYYIVVVRDSGTFKFYVNNKLIAFSSVNPTFSSSNNVRIGQMLSGYDTLEGYLSDIIYNPTTAITDFTPPTAPQSSTGTTLHIKGTDASIIDKSQSSNLKMFGSTTGSTTQVKFGGSKSMYFAGSLDDKVIAYAARDVDIPGNGEYTFEAWCYFNSVSGVIHMLSSADVTNRIAFELRNSKLAAMVGGSVIQSGSQVLSTGQWYHLAISRVTGSPYSTTRFFVNGNLDQTATNYQQSPAIDGFNEWIIGSPSPNNLGNGYNEVTGYMQDVRFTEGLGRYTANFTPPTASLEG